MAKGIGVFVAPCRNASVSSKLTRGAILALVAVVVVVAVKVGLHGNVGCGSKGLQGALYPPWLALDIGANFFRDCLF